MPSRPHLKTLLLPLALCATVALSGCITAYRDIDEARLHAAAPAKTLPALKYAVSGSSLLNGHLAIRETFDKQSPFLKTEQVTAPETPPADDLYVKATVENLPPSIPAGVAAYVSYSTLFLLPFWSTQDGSRVLFDVYRHGAHQKRYEYELHRRTFGWIVLTPFIWANAINHTEHDAFEYATKQFLADAAPVLSAP